jgi:hypothetical protein
MAFPFGLRNAAQDAQRLAALHTSSEPVNIEFVGMADYVSESIHDLLVGASENLFDSNSSEASHHPSRECIMVNTPERPPPRPTPATLPEEAPIPRRPRGLNSCKTGKRKSTSPCISWSRNASKLDDSWDTAEIPGVHVPAPMR